MSERAPVRHWLVQRFTAVLLVPLSLWLILSLALVPLSTTAAWIAWLSNPINNLLVSLTFLTGLYHGKLGLEVIIEDYLSVPFARSILLLFLVFVHLVLGLVTLLALITVLAQG